MDVDVAPEASGSGTRRSTRLRDKPVKQTAAATADQDDRDGSDMSDGEDQDEEEEEEEEEEYRATRSKGKKAASKGNKAAGETSTKGKKRKSAENGRKDHDNEAAGDGQGAAAGARKKKARTTAGKQTSGGGAAAEKRSKQAKQPATATNGRKVPAGGQPLVIPEDNGLFYALLSSDISLDAVAETWVDGFGQTGQGNEGEAQERMYLAELVLFAIRCAGLSFEITPEQAEDVDGVPDVLDDIQSKLAEGEQPSDYPLVSRDKRFKGFAKSLSSLIAKLVEHLSSTPLLYLTPDSPPPSSGPTTPIIHLMLSWLHPMTTSPYRAIRHTATRIVLELGAALCSIAQQVRDESAEAKKQFELETKRGKKGEKVLKSLQARAEESKEKEATMDEYLDDVFNGVFVHRYRDKDPLIRAECLRQLGVFMARYPSKFVDAQHLHYVDWALTDGDNHARLEAVKSVVPLYDTDVHLRSMRVFTARALPRLVEMAARDIDSRVRSQAVRVLCALEELGKLEDENPEKRQQAAALIFDREPKIRRAIAPLIKSLLETRNAELSEGQSLSAEEEQYTAIKAIAGVLLEVSNELDGDQAAAATSSALGAFASHVADIATRPVVVMDALFAEIPTLQDWSTVLSCLTIDHSKKRSDGVVWALTDEEELFMLEIADAVLGQVIRENQEVAPDVTRALIDAAPKLFTRHQSDPKRLSAVLDLASRSDFGAIKELGIDETLVWDQVIRQFSRQSDADVLQRTLRVLRALLVSSNQDLAADKIQELKDEIAAGLRKSLADKEIEQANFDDAELQSVQSALLRIKTLFPFYDLRDVLLAKGAQESSLWDAVLALAERGKLGWKEEDKTAQFALDVLTWDLVWVAATGDESAKTRQEEVIKLLKDLTFADNMMPTESVRRQAIHSLLKLHTIFNPAKAQTDAQKAMAVELEDSVQFRLEGKIQSVIDHHIEAIASEDDEPLDDHVGRHPDFYALLWTYVAALKAGVVDAQHAAVLLNNYGLVDKMFDQAIPMAVELLAMEAEQNDEVELLVSVVCQALQRSFESAIDASPDDALALAKQVQPAFFTQKIGFKVDIRVKGAAQDLHERSIKWAVDGIAKKSPTTKRVGHVDYFRVLLLLVPALRPREALACRQCLQETLKSKGVQPPAKSKVWEPLAAYERRLDSIATTDSKIQAAAAAKQAANAAIALPGTQDSEEGRPRPKPKAGSAPATQDSVFDESLDDIELPDIPIDDDMLPIDDD